jgi:hypothetical protein
MQGAAFSMGKARHCEARSAEAIQKRHLLRWIASLRSQ